MTMTRPLFNTEVLKAEISQIRQFDDKVSTFGDLIRLTLGQPDFKTPDHIKEAAKRAIDGDFSFYTPTAGYLPLRQAAADFVREKYRLNYDPKTEVQATVGATEALAATLLTLLNPGDKVIIPSPFFSLYESLVRYAKAEPIFIDTSATGFKVDPAILKKTIAAHGDCLKAVIFNYPNNPTGTTWNEAEVKEIADILRTYPDVIAISDEIYSEIVYDQPFVSLGEHLRDQTVVINGLSKSHAMTGWRLGLIFAPKYLSEQIVKTHQSLVTSASSITQYAAVEALTAGKNDALSMKEQYQKRRDVVIKALRALDFEIAEPTGAFYIFARIPEQFGQNSFDFCYELARETKVALIPGAAFGAAGEGYVRLSYAASLSDITEAMNRIHTYITQHSQ
ncbi:aminotransferase class I/II-fold pyridoxal phosphate-dependent enzyme [Alkalibacterium sp. AK22]|uniref:aminotransferase class I/II-fold pyridoxal phosphate-dependent enzyme n=1 Tax=Alkalibacterium sp. AK22 TaxID=1229520 RepID=UPI0005564B28|nr:aminotransferase class I/II-fold pyridoxal phosphate-dependent enzyme [Alkalibacterium sp. AK22]